MTAGHLHSIDMLRGAASLSVMIYHLVLSGNVGRFDQLPGLHYLASFGHFGVQIFFVISGFVIPYSMHLANYQLTNFIKFIARRLVRLEPPYLISVMICFGLVYYEIYNPYNHGPFIPMTWQQVVLHVGYLTTYFDYQWLDSAYWTLAIEFQYYILIALIYPIIMRGKPAVIGLWLIGTTLAFTIKDHMLFFVHFPFFFLGITLFLLKSKLVSMKEAALCTLATAGVIVMVNDTQYMICGLTTLVMMVVSKGTGKVWVFFGGISYSLYLLHDPLGQTILSFAEHFTTNDWIMFAVLWPCILFLVFVSWLYKKYVEEPSQALSKKINY